jgi:hypothetical protein
MPVSGFCALTGIPRRTCHRYLARARRGDHPVKGPWPAPVVERWEPVAAKYAADWPGWGPPEDPHPDGGGRASHLSAGGGAGDAPPQPAPAGGLPGAAP